MTKNVFAQIIWDKTFETKQRNSVKLQKTGKVWYLLSRVFHGYCQSLVSGRETGH